MVGFGTYTRDFLGSILSMAQYSTMNSIYHLTEIPCQAMSHVYHMDMTNCLLFLLLLCDCKLPLIYRTKIILPIIYPLYKFMCRTIFPILSLEGWRTTTEMLKRLEQEWANYRDLALAHAHPGPLRTVLAASVPTLYTLQNRGQKGGVGFFPAFKK